MIADATLPWCAHDTQSRTFCSSPHHSWATSAGVWPFSVSFLFFILDLLSFSLFVAFFAGGWLLLKTNRSSKMWNQFCWSMDSNSWSWKRGYRPKYGSKPYKKWNQQMITIYSCPISMCKVQPAWLHLGETWTHQPGFWKLWLNAPNVISTRHWHVGMW